ncbi:MAG: hypothetical protein WCF18_20480 [Chthoniobacteraceae bacterium]
MTFSKITLSALFLTAATRAFACDLCGCYIPRLQVVHEKPASFYAGIAEQFTHFGTDRFNGDEVDNPTDQHLDSSITQFFVGATFLQNRVGLQLNVPYIYRSYERPEGFEIEHGDESGLGDLSLLANFVVFKTDGLYREEPAPSSKDGKSVAMASRGEPDFSASVNLLAGVKFPTGDASRIKEEFNEVEVEGAPESGIHGHDLALGTGSYDGVFGLQSFVRYKEVFFQADAQFTLRGRGHYSYRYANDLQWNGGPGVYLHRRGGDSIALQCVVAGETKGYDHFQGERALDTGITSLYVGPRVTATFGRISGDVGVDLPVIMNTTKFQTTPDYRIHAGLTIHF